MKTRLFTILLTVLSFSLSFGQTATAPASGDGSAGSPYQIATLDNLYWIIQNSGEWSKNFEQTGDIDATSTSGWDGNQGWTPIGNSTVQFTGSYDGKGHTISNLFINRPSTTYQGMFGYSDGSAVIKNLGLTSVNITSGQLSGVLLAKAYNNTTVDNCYATGNLTIASGSLVAGGLVGYLGDDGSATCTLQNSYSEVNVSASAVKYVGGLCGMIKGSGTSITKCYSTGDIAGVDDNSGAFLGNTQTGVTVSECYCTGNINANNASNVAPFIGSVLAATISNCYSSGSVSGTGTNSAGGFIANNTGTVEYCYSTGTNNIEASSGFIKSSTGTLTSNFLDVEASGCTDGTAGNGNGDDTAIEETTANMKTTSTYTSESWDFTSTWEIVGGDGANYPTLKEAPVPVELTSFEAVAKNGSVLLTWETATEVNNYGFDVEASNDGEYFNKIGFVAGHGNSNSPNSYSFVASAALSYRLKQIDTDGGFEYSQEISVSGELAKTEMYQNHPNPFNPATQISFTLAKANNVKISVFNILGEKVAELINSKMAAGIHKVNFNASELTTGVYIYKIDTPNYTKSMKMLLLK